MDMDGNLKTLGQLLMPRLQKSPKILVCRQEILVCRQAGKKPRSDCPKSEDCKTSDTISWKHESI